LASGEIDNRNSINSSCELSCTLSSVCNGGLDKTLTYKKDEKVTYRSKTMIFRKYLLKSTKSSTDQLKNTKLIN
jgi:hypothetical protein